MALERYRQKRDFSITPEPKGDANAKGRTGKGPAGLTFVIQKHAASHLHYDFRLELDGVFLSWAVPKGPSLDPNDKRLAMHVEDHPLEYGDFEGIIPAKQYGGGTVMLWDRGVWVPKSDPKAAYDKGRLKFELQGEKLRGGWNLVRSHGGKYGGPKSWLLFKEADEHARLGEAASIVDDLPSSVSTGRSLDEIAASADRVWNSNRPVDGETATNAGARVKPVAGAKPVAGLSKIPLARKMAMPDVVDAQLATLVKVPPSGSNWIHEIKYDGYRMLCRVEGSNARMMSRNEKDWTDDFRELAGIVAQLPLKTAWLDGEVVAMDAEGRSSFQSLQNALAASPPTELDYLVFDLLYLDGYDLRPVALTERKRLLESLLSGAPKRVRYSEHFSAPGDAFLDNVCKLGLEGMISKRGDLAYSPGRGSAWVKIKCDRRQEMVIGGFSDPGGSRSGFGALLLGVYDDDGRLRYSGRVGTGFDDATLTTLARKLAAIEQPKTAFHNPPRGADARGVHWVAPDLVAEVSFTEWTAEGTLRHPSFQGLREDKDPREVVRETAAGPMSEPSIEPAPRGAIEPASVAQKAPARGHGKTTSADAPGTIAGIVLSNPDKILYPEAALTKLHLARFYEQVETWILPHLRQRPLTLLRCPNGWDKPCFYQKNADASVIDAIERVKVDASDGSQSSYMMANSLTAVVGLLQMGTLELHPWGSTQGSLGFPDRLIFDLDPDDAVAWPEVKQAALLVKTLVENLGLQAFVKTTGGKGLHVVVAIEPTTGWEDAKGFTKAIAELLEHTFPDRFTSKLLKVSRHKKIFIDYLRNAEGATAVAAYSIRSKANAPVSTPVEWRELARDIRYDYFNVKNVPKRLAKLGRDPWADMFSAARPLDDAMMAKVGYSRK